MLKFKLIVPLMVSSIRTYSRKAAPKYVGKNSQCCYSIKGPNGSNFLFASAEMSTSNKVATFEDVIAVVENNDVLLIDVREPNELKETGRIPGSINIPLGDIENVLKNTSNDEFKKRYGCEKPSYKTSIIFQCRSGIRSGKALATAEKLGYKNGRNYSGGWLDWEEKIKTRK